MKIYYSEFQIPELQQMPVKDARELWQSCLHSQKAVNIRLAILVPGILILAFIDMPGLLGGMIIAASIWISELAQIALLRPKISETLQRRSLRR